MTNTGRIRIRTALLNSVLLSRRAGHQGASIKSYLDRLHGLRMEPDQVARMIRSAWTEGLIQTTKGRLDLTDKGFQQLRG